MPFNNQMTETPGFAALPEQWKGLLVFMRHANATDNDFINVVHGRIPEEHIIFLWCAWGNKRKIARLVRTSPKRVVRTVNYFVRTHKVPDKSPVHLREAAPRRQVHCSSLAFSQWSCWTIGFRQVWFRDNCWMRDKNCLMDPHVG